MTMQEILLLIIAVELGWISIMSIKTVFGMFGKLKGPPWTEPLPHSSECKGIPAQLDFIGCFCRTFLEEYRKRNPIAPNN